MGVCIALRRKMMIKAPTDCYIILQSAATTTAHTYHVLHRKQVRETFGCRGKDVEKCSTVVWYLVYLLHCMLQKNITTDPHHLSPILQYSTNNTQNHYYCTVTSSCTSFFICFYLAFNITTLFIKSIQGILY